MIRGCSSGIWISAASICWSFGSKEKVDIFNYKTFADKHNALITAGVDATLLKEGPVEAIVERIRLYIDKMARDQRCMIHFNQIPAETPPEHIHAAVAACHSYGRHPIPENLDDLAFELPKRESFAEFMRAKGEPRIS